MSLDSFGD